MIIDFHTHAFPDALAERAMGRLVGDGHGIYPPCSDGTVAGLIRCMDGFGVDASVIQPIVTKPSQTENLNRWAKSVESERICSFGGIHPETDDYKRDIDFVASLGIRGLKFHVEYQGFVLDDPKMLRIYDYAFEKGLIILHHAGFDPAFKPPFRSSPDRFLNVVKQMQGGTMIAAHLGGHAQWDDVLDKLAGENIYLDTSMGQKFYSPEQFISIVRAHGADKILFGSDSPWSRADEEIELIKNSALTEEEKNLILGENAKRLLKL